MKPYRWTVVILYIALIFVTMPYVPRLWAVFSRLLGGRTSVVVDVGYIVMGLYLFLYSYFRMQKRTFIFYLAMSLIFLCLGLLLRWLNLPIEKVHLLEYGLLSFLIYWASRAEVKPSCINTGRLFSYGIVLTGGLLVGLCDELVQRVIPTRVYEWKDIFLNWLAGILGLLLIVVFKECD